MQTLILIAALFILVHLFKMMRLYLVLMEHKISFMRFVLLYLRTTLINLIIPFKLGEIYRIEEIARETKVWQVGVLSVIVDRYFDTFALFCILLPIDFWVGGKLSIITMVFLVLILAAFLIYLAIPSCYRYLNRYLIMKRASSRTMAALKGMDVVYSWYCYTAQLVRGRFPLIIGASLLGWLAEAGALKTLAGYKNIPFSLKDFTQYIESIFMLGSHELLQYYVRLSVGVILSLTVIGYIIRLIFFIKDKKKTV